MPSLGTLALSTAVLGSANGLGFVISAATGSHLHLDLIGTGAFAVSSAATLHLARNRIHRLSACCVGVWSLKLATFLFYRAVQTKHDARLDEMLSSTAGAAAFWGISFAWGAFCMLPHNLGMLGSVAPKTLARLPTCVGVGVAMFGAGLMIETMSDYQKWAFKASNPGKFCDVGLWQYSQHPNYCGNLIIWCGIVQMNLPNLLTRSKNPLMQYARLAGAVWAPIFMYGLFYAQSSGMIADTVQMSHDKYKNDPRYAEYLRSTPLLFPNIFKY